MINRNKWILGGVVIFVLYLIVKYGFLSALGIHVGENPKADLYLALTVIAFVVAGIIFQEKSQASKWIKTIGIFCLLTLLAMGMGSCYRSCTGKDDNKKNQKNSSQQIVPPTQGHPSEVKKASWGKLVTFTGQEPGGVKLCERNENIRYRSLKIELIGGPGIVDNTRGDMWPIWGADGFAPGWREHFFYPDVATPNAVLVVGGKPGDARIQNVCKFNKGETEITVEAPGDTPIYLYYHDAMIKQGDHYPYFEDNSGYFTFQVEIKEFYY